MRYWPVYGGGETITATLSNAFIKKGINVHIAYQHESSRNPMPYVINSKIHQFRIKTYGKFDSTDIRLMHDYVVNHNIDIMINQWGDVELCDLARRGTKCRLVTCWHLNVIIPPNCNDVKHKLFKWFIGNKLYTRYSRRKQIEAHLNNYKHSDKYVFLSPSFTKQFSDLTGIAFSDSKLGHIPNPLTYQLEYPIDNFIKKKKQVLFVGRIFEFHKRLSYVLKVWQSIEKDGKYDEWNLVIVGDGPDLESTQFLAKKLNLKRVIFKGYQNPRSFYEESSIFVMTSSLEGFGMTLVEAQQCACVPMAMDSYSSLHDIISNGFNGFIIPDNDLTLYKSKLMSLIDNIELRKQLAINGLNSSKKFSVDNIVTLWEKLFINC